MFVANRSPPPLSAALIGQITTRKQNQLLFSYLTFVSIWWYIVGTVQPINSVAQFNSICVILETFPIPSSG